jgi:hypothetical protein
MAMAILRHLCFYFSQVVLKKWPSEDLGTSDSLKKKYQGDQVLDFSECIMSLGQGSLLGQAETSHIKISFLERFLGK